MIGSMGSYSQGMWTVDTVDDKFIITPSFVRYLLENQNTDLKLATEHYSLKETGIYELLDCFTFKSVTIFTWNVLEKHDRYKIVQYTSRLYMLRPYAWGEWNVTDKDREWDNSTRFITMYGRPTAFRIGIASYLNSKYPLMSQIYLASGERANFDLNKLYTVDKDALINFALLEPKLPLIPTNAVYDNLVWTKNSSYIKYYRHSLIDVVVEPNLVGDVFNPTEKVARPILLKKPFIIMGSRNIIANLQKLGFKTFSNFWNEGYDEVESEARYHYILTVIDYIASLSDEAILTMYDKMQSILEHNYQLLVSQKFNVYQDFKV